MKTENPEDLIAHVSKNPQACSGRGVSKEEPLCNMGGYMGTGEGPFLVLLKAVSLRVPNAPKEQLYPL